MSNEQLENLDAVDGEDVKQQAAQPTEPNEAEQAEIDDLAKKTIARQNELASKSSDIALIASTNWDTAWRELLVAILQRMGDTKENADFLTKKTAQLQHVSKQLALNAVQLADLHNYFINGGVPMDMGAKFVMDDYCRGVMNYGYAMPPAIFNIFDATAPGADDPRWVYDRLPFKEVVSAPGKASVPVRVETFTEIIYGYLECFNYQRQTPSGRLVTIQTTHPAIRTKTGWMTPNSVMRWLRCDSNVVKTSWVTNKSVYVKVKLEDDEPTEA